MGGKVGGVRYGRLCLDVFGPVRHWEVQLQIARRPVMVGSRWQWVAGGGAMSLGNAIADC